MLIKHYRTTFGEEATLGYFEIDGVHECVTLEDRVRPEGEKVFGKTAIPSGKYRVIINLSPKFKKMMMRLHDVSGFTGILIHSGNTPEDTLGCILVGQHIDNDKHIHGGSVACPSLQAKVQAAIDRGEEVWIEIIEVH